MTQDLAIARRVLNSEADALNSLASSLDDTFSNAVSACFNAKGRIICAGIGKSGHVARKIAATFASTGSPAQFVHPNEASHGDLGMITSSDVVLALSRSGGNVELNDVIHYTRRFGIPLIAMTAKKNSDLARASDIALLIPDVPEACAQTSAPTTSTTLMMALGDALAVALIERRCFRADDFRTFHPGGKLGAMLKTAGDLMHVGDALPLAASGTSLSDALNILSDKGFGCVGITDASGKLLGMLTDGDVRRLLLSDRPVTRIDHAMTPNPFTVAPNDLAPSILKFLNDQKINQIFVVEDSKPVGVLHIHDFLQAGVN